MILIFFKGEFLGSPRGGGQSLSKLIFKMFNNMLCGYSILMPREV